MCGWENIWAYEWNIHRGMSKLHNNSFVGINVHQKLLEAGIASSVERLNYGLDDPMF